MLIRVKHKVYHSISVGTHAKHHNVQNIQLTKIINKYLPLGDLLDCQEELIEAGYEEFAQL